jgi:hypothetical protein
MLFVCCRAATAHAPQAASDAPLPAYSGEFIRRRLVVFVGIVLG